MTLDPLAALLDQLAAVGEQLTRLDAREAGHYQAIAAQLANLTVRLTHEPGRSRPRRIPARPRTSLVARSAPATGRNRSPGCAPGWTRSTAPATATSPPPWPPAGQPTTCACTRSTSWPLCGRCSTSSRTAPPGLISAQAEYQARLLPALAAQLQAETHRCGHARIPAPPVTPAEHTMTSPVLRQALAFAASGWPVLPCQPGQKIPATTHGYRDATTDPDQITAWFGRHPAGTWPSPPAPPAPTSWTSTTTARPATATPPSASSKQAGLLDSATVYVRTPSGGLHAYFTGTTQHCGHLPDCHLDFRSAGGYVLTPPSQIGGRPYQLIAQPGGRGHLDWAAVTALLHPGRQHRPPQPQQVQGPGRDLGSLARWVAAQPEGNRNAGLFWAANRALETDPAADLSPLAAAARQAGLPDAEITRTLGSARRTSQPHPRQPDHQAEVH